MRLREIDEQAVARRYRNPIRDKEILGFPQDKGRRKKKGINQRHQILQLKTDI